MLEQIIDTIKQAGSIYKSADKDIDIVQKSSKNDLVTKYDKEIQDFLENKLSKILPNCTFLAEEGSDQKELKNGWCFIIDPIDGTTNFIKNFNHSAICVGLAKDKELVLGIVYDVDKNDLYYAQKGKGAYLNNEQIHVSDSSFTNSLVLFGTSPYARENAHKTFEITEKVFLNSLEIRRCGSAALDICYVACGKADLYYEMVIAPWDVAAATIILTEAGGICQRLDKTPIDLHTRGTYICGNSKNIKEFYEIIKI